MASRLAVYFISACLHTIKIELNQVFPAVRIGDIVGIISEYNQEQFNAQMSILDNTDLYYISKEDLIQIIKERF